jgi:YidC/Oxa1 family membrane protein insertase
MFVLGNILQPIIDVFDAVLRFFHDNVGVGWGFSIILLTVVVRLLLLPLTVKQFKSMAAMQRLAPHIKELQQKYKDDKQRQQQELMAFYKEHQVNPFGSCLPLLLQMPVFISLFYMLRKDLKIDICAQKLTEIGAIVTTNGHHKVINNALLQKTACDTPNAKFLFIPDITTKATGAVLVALIVMYVGSQLLSSILMSASADRNQRLLMIGLPFLFVTFIISFPAGLIVYWITTNLWTVGQSYLMRQRLGHLREPLAATGGGKASSAAAAAPPKKPKRGEPPVEETKPSAPPPRPPRQKKKRSGRRR